MSTLQYFRALILIFMQPSHTFCRHPKCAAASRHAPLRQTYALPNPNARRLQNRRQGHAPLTLGHSPWLSRPPRIQEQAACYYQDLGFLMALPSRRRAPRIHFTDEQMFFGGGASGRHAGDVPRRSRLRTVPICVENGALAPARCSFSLYARS